MRFSRLLAPVFVFVLVFGTAAPAGAQSCFIGLLCPPKVQPELPPPPPSPPPPPPPALPPTDGVTEPVTGVVDSVQQTLRTPVSSMESQMLSLVNGERARAGLQPLQVSAWAASFARGFSQKMMAAGSIWHNQEYFSKGRTAMGADLLSENVAYDSSIPANHAGLMASPGHRANILDRRLTHVGIGVAVSSAGRIYVTQDFARIPGSSAPPAAGGVAAPGTRRADSPPVALSIANAQGTAVRDYAAAETITLGKAARAESTDPVSGGASEASEQTSPAYSPAPMIPGLIAGGLIALLAPLALFAKKLMYLFGK